MSFFINPFQLFERGVGIDLRRVNTFMAQQFLDALKSCTIIQHRCSEGVPQHVGRALLQRCHQRQILTHDQINLTPRHPLSFIAQKQSTVLTQSELFPPGLEILPKRICQLLTKGNDPLLVPLSRHLQLPGTKINIYIIQSRQFRSSEPCFIE